MIVGLLRKMAGSEEVFVWAGIGGFPSVYGNSQVRSSLIQSGFAVGQNIGNIAGTFVNLYYEFVNAIPIGGPQFAALPSGWSSGDIVLVVGTGVHTSACQTIDSNAPWACYAWYVLTAEQQNEQNNNTSPPFSTGTWNNSMGTPSPPVDPMYLVYQNF